MHLFSCKQRLNLSNCSVPNSVTHLRSNLPNHLSEQIRSPTGQAVLQFKVFEHSELNLQLVAFPPHFNITQPKSGCPGKFSSKVAACEKTNREAM